MTEHFSKLSREETEVLARKARHNPKNTAGLIWSAAGIVIFFYMLFWLPAELFDKISLVLRPILASLIVAFIGGGVVAFAYYFWAKPRTNVAVAEYEEYQRTYRAYREREKRAEIEEMQQKEEAV